MNNKIKIIGIACIVWSMLSVSGCASHVDKGYYKRANAASEKAHERFDRE